MMRTLRPTAFVACAAAFIAALPAAVVVASSSEGERAQASAASVTRSALGVAVLRPFGETARNDTSGFDGRPAFERIQLPNGAASSSTLGPDGAIWFVDQEGFVVRFDPLTRKTRRFDTGGATGEITTGADGRIYVAASQRTGSYVTVLTPEGRKIRDVDVPFAILALEPSADGIWFSSSDLAFPQQKYSVGRIAPNGKVRTTSTETIDELQGPLVGKMRPEALARLSDGSMGIAGVTTYRMRGLGNRTADPLFAGATGDDRFGPITSAVGGTDGTLFVSRVTQGQDHSVIWRSAEGTAAPYVPVPDEAILQQFEPTEPSSFEAGTVGPTALGPDGKLWFVTWRNLSQDIRAGGFLGRVDDQSHLTEWRMPYRAGEISSAVAAESLTVGVDGRLWFTDADRGQMVGFTVPDLRGWRSLKPSIVSARHEKGRAAVRILCVGPPGKLCFGQVSLSRGGKQVGPKLTYDVRAHSRGAGPEIVRYLKLPAGSTRGLAVRLSNGPRATVR